MRRVIIGTILLCILSTSNVYAQLQGQALIDSLLKELPRQKEDTIKGKLLMAISKNYDKDRNIEAAIKYCQIGLALSEQLKWDQGLSFFNEWIGWRYILKCDYPQSLKYLNASLVVRKKLNDPTLVVNTYQNIAWVYYCQGNYTENLKYNLAALKVAEEARDTTLECRIYCGLLGAYGKLSNNEEAERVFNKLMNIMRIRPDTQVLRVAYTNVSVSFMDRGRYKEALDLSLKALMLYHNPHKDFSTITLRTNLGETYEKLGQFDSALKYQFSALKSGQEAEDINSISTIYFGIANVYLKQKKYKEAIAYDEKSIALAKQCNSQENLKEANESLSKIYTATGQHEKALEAYKQYIVARDSSYNSEAMTRSAQAQMEYEYDKKETIAKAEQEKKDILQKNIRNSIGTGMVGLLVFSVVVYRQRNKVKKEKANVERVKARVEVEKARSDELLLNILPAEIAEELKTSGSSTARHFDNVTVLFTDFVNFTEAADKMGAQELIDELHSCFKEFDEITGKYKIEKIKTIGDAYLAVAGLPLADVKHAEHVVMAATEINAFMQNRLKSIGDKTFQIRIGVNSGSVVAGIVGVKKFAYDIWGDTVNTAARMEQNSEAGKINISQTTYELVRDKITCTYRGEIDAKGKGMLKMYFVQ